MPPRFPAARRRGSAARRLRLHPDARAHRAPDRAAHRDADRRQPRSPDHPHPLQAAARARPDRSPTSRRSNRDIDDMQSMLEGYLEFARGEAAEDPGRFDLAGYFDKLADEAKLRKRTLTTTLTGDPTIHVRPNAFARLLANVIGNSLRYAKNVRVEADPHARLAHRHHRRRRSRHSRRRAARTSSSPSCGSTRRAISTPAAPGSASPSPATSPAATAATSRWTTARWAACAPSCAFRPEPNCIRLRHSAIALANIGVARGRSLPILFERTLPGRSQRSAHSHGIGRKHARKDLEQEALRIPRPLRRARWHRATSKPRQACFRTIATGAIS